MSQSESQEWGRLTVRLEKSFGQAVDTHELELESRVGKINSKTSNIIKQQIQMSQSESQKSVSLTVRLVKSFGQRVDTNELEGESRVGKINSKTSNIIWSESRYK